MAVSTDNTFSSEWLNATLIEFRFASSYDEIVRYKQNMIRFENADVCHKMMITQTQVIQFYTVVIIVPEYYILLE